MKKNKMDMFTDELKSRMTSIYAEIHKEYGGSNPYRQVPMTRAEQLTQYQNMTPDLMQQRIQRDGVVATNDYISKMEKLKVGG